MARTTGDEPVSRKVTVEYSSEALELRGVAPSWADKSQYLQPLFASASVSG